VDEVGELVFGVSHGYFLISARAGAVGVIQTFL
jgi:hypothetical protein